MDAWWLFQKKLVGWLQHNNKKKKASKKYDVSENYDVLL